MTVQETYKNLSFFNNFAPKDNAGTKSHRYFFGIAFFFQFFSPIGQPKGRLSPARSGSLVGAPSLGQKNMFLVQKSQKIKVSEPGDVTIEFLAKNCI